MGSEYWTERRGRRKLWLNIQTFRGTRLVIKSMYILHKLFQTDFDAFGTTGCPTSIFPFSKAYFTKTKAARWKIPTVLGVSWSAILYEKKIFFWKILKKRP